MKQSLKSGHSEIIFLISFQQILLSVLGIEARSRQIFGGGSNQGGDDDLMGEGSGLSLSGF